MAQDALVRTWRRAASALSGSAPGGTYTVSTDGSLVDLGALNAALGSDLLWWASALPADALRAVVDNSLCFGLYHRDSDNDGASSEPAAAAAGAMIGLARVITDRVTFCYLTDVYVLPAYQGCGLGRWMLGCVDELVSGVDATATTTTTENHLARHMRGFLLLTSGSAESRRLYGDTLRAVPSTEGRLKNLTLMERAGPAGKGRKDAEEAGKEEDKAT